jgi:hypothetical protein
MLSLSGETRLTTREREEERPGEGASLAVERGGGTSPGNVERVFIPREGGEGEGSAKEEEKKRRARGSSTESENDHFFSFSKSCPSGPLLEEVVCESIRAA